MAMDELELLKKDWQKKEENLPKLSYDDIYKMLWKKSSSVVKWIFYISIIEFILPHLLYLVPTLPSAGDVYDKLAIKDLLIALTVIQYSIIFYFIYQFYLRYREISILDDAKQLIKNILRTRKTVKNYVFFSLSMVLLLFAVLITGIYFASPDDVVIAFKLNRDSAQTRPEELRVLLMWTIGIGGFVFTVLLGGIYFLLYGLLTRKLSKNYKELKKLEG